MTQPAVSTMITLDRERTLRFDYDALNALSNLSVVERGGDRSPLDLWRLAGGMDTRAMSRMLWAACRHEDKGITVEQMYRAITQALRERVTTYRKLNEALNAAINQSECMGLFQADEEPEGDEGNGRTPTGMRPGTSE